MKSFKIQKPRINYINLYRGYAVRMKLDATHLDRDVFGHGLRIKRSYITTGRSYDIIGVMSNLNKYRSSIILRQNKTFSTETTTSLGGVTLNYTDFDSCMTIHGWISNINKVPHNGYS